ncbi:MAG: helix-turn-helix domain-containing protein [Acidobacteriota bacterium]
MSHDSQEAGPQEAGPQETGPREAGPRGVEPQEAGPPVEASYTIKDLGQLKALADPLRVRILEALCEQPRTTKQVAERLGEKPTKLYHHVDALEKVGLIGLHSTRPNRGTLEKYFRSVARAFRVDDNLFSDPASTGWAALGGDLLSRGAEEVRALEGKDLGGLQPMLVHLKATARPEKIERLQAEVQQLLDDLAEEEEDPAEGDAEEVEFQMILALYPILKP